MSQDALVSIVVPAYNAELHLSECLDSILKQTYSNLQIIVIDDGSTDSTAIICDEYKKKDNRVTIIHQKNKGVSASRNIGIDIAEGEFLQFVDADDLLVPEAVEHTVRHLTKSSADALYFNFAAFSGNKLIKRSKIAYKDFPVVEKSDRKETFKFINSGFISNYIWAFLFRTVFLKKNHIFFDSSLSFGEDVLFVNEVALAASYISYLNEPIYLYRKEQGTVTQRHTVKYSLSDLRVVSSLDLLHKNNADLDDLGYNTLRLRLLIDAYSILPAYKSTNKEKKVAEQIKDSIVKSVSWKNLMTLPYVYWIKYYLLKTNLYDLVAAFILRKRGTK